MSTDILCFCFANGQVLNFKAQNLPAGRGDGQALTIMLSLQQDEDLVDVLILNQKQKYLLVSYQGRGMYVKGHSLYSQRRGGRQVMKLKNEDRLVVCRPINGDYVAILSSNNRFLIFPAEQIPLLAFGQGVLLQRYKSGIHIKQLTFFDSKKGLVWPGFVKARDFEDLQKWVGNRGSVGKLAPAWSLRGEVLSE